MSEPLFEFLGVTVTVTGAYAVFSVLTLILFMALWLFGRKKRTGQPVFAGQVMNGAGFGLLPALAVLKAFQEMSTGAGAKIIEPMPAVRWLTENGLYRPGRIETAAAAAAFILVCLWLIVKKSEPPDNGDLLMITVCLWASIRLVTEDFRAEPQDLFRYTSCATLLFCLTVWCIRRAKGIRMPGRTIADLLAAGICAAINLLTAKHLLSAGSEIGDFAVKAGSNAMVLLLTLIAGADVRRMIRRQQDHPG